MYLRIDRAHFLSLALTTLLVSAMPARAAEPLTASAADAAAEGQMKKLLEAIESKSYEDFAIECDDTMRAALTRQNFEGITGIYGPMLQKAYKTTLLGKLRQKGFITYLWKLEPSEGKDEFLLKISVKNRKVGGFFIQ
jgi:hypothetical protein